MIVTDQYEPMVGGVPTVTRELARGLAERGHAVAVIAPSTSRHAAGRTGPGRRADDRGPSAARCAGPGTRASASACCRAAAGRELIAAFRARRGAHPLAADARRSRPGRPPGDGGVPGALHQPLPARQRLAPARARHPRRAAARVSGARREQSAFYGFVTGFANRCDHVTAPTATALRLLRDHGLRAPSQAVSNGVDLDALLAPGQADEALRRGTRCRRAGRSSCRSAGSARRSGRTCSSRRCPGSPPGRTGGGDGQDGPVLALAGTGPTTARLRALARRLGVADRVRFLGFVPDDDLPGLYRLADVFAIASQAELQSLVTMAAMASGLPVVAVDAGALAELVHPGENGFLSPGPGRAGEVADCLDLLCRDPGLRARMSKASARIIGDHDRHRLLARWESIYRALAAPRGQRKREQMKVSDGQP